jgi:hypothetical protein
MNYHITCNWKLYSRVRSSMCWSFCVWWRIEVDCQICVVVHRSKKERKRPGGGNHKAFFLVDIISNFQARKNWSRRVRPSYSFPWEQGTNTNTLRTISAYIQHKVRFHCYPYSRFITVVCCNEMFAPLIKRVLMRIYSWHRTCTCS